jgi:hypothetical protein
VREVASVSAGNVVGGEWVCYEIDTIRDKREEEEEEM